MNENPFEQFKKDIQAVRLEATAKRRIRDSLVAYMRAHPAPEITGGLLSFFAARTRSVSVLMTLVLVVTLAGGMAVASEGSLPGDALYPVKVKIAEEIRSVFALSNASSARVAIERAERRLEEAVVLASRGKLADADAATLARKFEEHTDELKKHIEQVESESGTETARSLTEEFRATLNAHQAVLEEILGERGPIIASIETAAHNVANASSSATSSATFSSADAENMMKQAKEQREMSGEFFKEKRGLLTVENDQALTRLFEQSDAALAYGEDQMTRELYADAHESFSYALQLAQHVEIFLEAKDRFGIEIDLAKALAKLTATSTATSTPPLESATSTEDAAGEDNICAQVVTVARNPSTGDVNEFATPCDVPEGWEIVGKDDSTNR